MTLKKLTILFLIFTSNVALSAQWVGKYLSLNGKNVLVVESEDFLEMVVEFDIVDIKVLERKASFFAYFNNDFAETKPIVNDSGCKLKLLRSNSGIFVSDFCEGSEILTGFYERSNDFFLESIQIFEK